MNCDDKFYTTLHKVLHVKYFKRQIGLLSAECAVFESTMLTGIFFALSGLDILNALDVLCDTKKREIINWIYSLQIEPDLDDKSSWDRCGFQASRALEVSSDCGENFAAHYKYGHIAMTYSGLASLLILGDDLRQVNKKAIIHGLRALQQENGSFCASLYGSESDMRFVYCAVCISYILGDWSGIDREKTISFIKRSMSYDFGIGQGPGLESHGGTTFCAVASLTLMGQLYSVFTEEQIKGLKRWTLFRQVSSFQGRPNKPEDTCYSFWVGATLKLLDMFHFVNYEANRNFIISTQDTVTGGFSKWPETLQDPLHTYFGICGLSLMEEEGLNPVHPGLNVSERAHNHLKSLHKLWGIDTCEEMR